LYSVLVCLTIFVPVHEFKINKISIEKIYAVFFILTNLSFYIIHCFLPDCSLPLFSMFIALILFYNDLYLIWHGKSVYGHSVGGRFFCNTVIPGFNCLNIRSGYRLVQTGDS